MAGYKVSESLAGCRCRCGLCARFRLDRFVDLEGLANVDDVLVSLEADDVVDCLAAKTKVSGEVRDALPGGMMAAQKDGQVRLYSCCHCVVTFLSRICKTIAPLLYPIVAGHKDVRWREGKPRNII